MLGHAVGKRLLAYVTVAGAGLTVCAAHAEAKVLYTPVHSFVDLNYPLDLNHDGITDFHLSSFDFSEEGAVNIHPRVKGNKIAATNVSCFGSAAAALPAGALIGPTVSFRPQANCLAASASYVPLGPWLQVKSAYLGLAFVIDGKIHFGWARLHVSHHFYYCGCIAALDGYAYETIPGKAIRAGDEGGENTESSVQPTTLGMLALGAPGLSLWRREQDQQ
jgi:hypothetical protein